MNRKPDLPKGYEPAQAEAKWVETWSRAGTFAPEPGDGPAFSVVIPPPNVTGSLHMGHALNITLQDILARYHRMKGEKVLWVPGTDHAGIATQNVVEKDLAKQGKQRDQLGRDEFVKKVWGWKDKYGGVILSQLKNLGASCDWSRLRFTMDDGLSRAVREVFVRLYNEGLIYRGEYMINWCPRCLTALSDIEVEQVPTQGKLWHIAYSLVGRDGRVVVATTRPETLLGDTAVAVHPEDERYAALKGRRVTIPFVDREAPIIFDPAVDKEFGTGAVKITPGHDFKDFEMGRRHGLPVVVVMDEAGRMSSEAGAFKGIDRFQCRKQIVKDLADKGLLVKEEEYEVLLGHCYRCRTVVEPRVSLQWFVKTEPLAKPAIQAVKDGRTRLVPSHWENTYFDWLENIRDWCISRQIWWGHRIPVWYCKSGIRDQGSGVGQECPPTISVNEPTACVTCGGRALEQDPDVLDTWFSSALWPFSTLGWPDQTEDLKRFYPTSVLVTGFDILFFWVARMMMMGLKFMGDVPFKDVYIHALVRDAEGKKMSKSKGNVIDPLDTMGEYGTDALRFTLASMVMLGRDLKLSWERIEGYKHFINKLWNSARFAFQYLDGAESSARHGEGDPGIYDRWILSRLSRTHESVCEQLDQYRFSDAAQELYHFVWSDFCDWYLELVKPVLQGGGESAHASSRTLQTVLTATLKLLHPFIPFVTEEIWQRGGFSETLLSRETFGTTPRHAADDGLEAEVQYLQEAVTEIRHLRSLMKIPHTEFITARSEFKTQEAEDILRSHKGSIERLAKCEMGVRGGAARAGSEKSAILSDGTIMYMHWEGGREQEISELNKKRKSAEEELASVHARLSKADFVQKAPSRVVERAKLRKVELQQLVAQIDERLAQVG